MPRWLGRGWRVSGVDVRCWNSKGAWDRKRYRHMKPKGVSKGGEWQAREGKGRILAAKWFATQTRNGSTRFAPVRPRLYSDSSPDLQVGEEFESRDPRLSSGASCVKLGDRVGRSLNRSTSQITLPLSVLNKTNIITTTRRPFSAFARSRYRKEIG